MQNHPPCLLPCRYDPLEDIIRVGEQYFVLPRSFVDMVCEFMANKYEGCSVQRATESLSGYLGGQRTCSIKLALVRFKHIVFQMQHLNCA